MAKGNFSDSNFRKMADELIDRKKWKDIIARFVDVLKINIFLVDYEGRIILPPSEQQRYGWSFFERVCLESSQGKIDLLGKFVKTGDYMEFHCESGLQAYAVPVSYDNHKYVLAYLIVGPVTLNRREDNEFYQNMAERMGVDFNELLGEINDVRVVSHVTMKSILDLLSEVAKDVTELNLERKKLASLSQNGQDNLSQQISAAAQDIYARIHLDELLVTLLDIALKMTNTECGSIMIQDEDSSDLVIKASRGLDESCVQNARVRVGAGIAGIAAQENQALVISGVEGENRIQQFLKRPEIKKSIVMPLSTKEKVFGVLNLHTKNDPDQVNESIEDLQYLSKLITAAFQSI